MGKKQNEDVTKATAKEENTASPKPPADSTPPPAPKTIELPTPEELSFDVYRNPATKEGRATYYFDLDEQGRPVKLGDGSFGAVFRVRISKSTHYKGNFAVKIFYADSDPADSASDDIRRKKTSDLEERFNLEMSFMENIRTLAERRNIEPSKLAGVLNPLGGTKDFKDSPAYKTLFSNKKITDVNASARAVVMDRYDGTLKDLLENSANDGVSGYEILKSMTPGHGIYSGHTNTKVSGYEILKSMTPNERITWILPLLSDVIDGLQTLYLGNYKHLDLKPANIFYKIRGDEKFELVIADMGYLYENENEPSFVVTTIHPMNDYERRPMLGTLHYRSPEQKDDYDVCDAEVKKIDKHTTALVIKDPKFNHSIVDQGDHVYFSKTTRKVPFLIKTIQKGSEQNNYVTTIHVINYQYTKDLQDDKKTQIVVRKRQMARTDLFGLGALAYDLITCGDSPERFYERMRVLDTDRNQNHILKIMEKYERVESFNSSEPIAQHIFGSLQYKGRYPARDFVEFILKCMLYSVPGTYYDLYRENDNIFKSLKDDFVSKFQLYEKIREGNAIIFQKSTPRLIEDVEPEKISSILTNIQNFGVDRIADRLILGFLYFREIFNYISAQVFREEEFYFAEFYPSNLIKLKDKRMRYNLRCHHTAFRKEADFQDALLNGELQVKLFLDRDDYFVPNYLNHSRKPVMISQQEPIPDDENERSTEYPYRLIFTTRSYAYDAVKRGDWILEYENEEPMNLYRIDAVQDEWVKVSFFKSKNTKETAARIRPSSANIRHIFFRDIDRLEYYLHILGMYVHQLFFFDQGALNTQVLAYVEQVHIDIFRNPQHRYRCMSVEQLMNQHYGNEVKEGDNLWERPIYALLATLTQMFAKLSFHQMEGTWYKDLSGISDETEKERQVQIIFASIKAAVNGLQHKIEDILEVYQYHLDGMGLPSTDSVRHHRGISEESKKSVSETYPHHFNFVRTLETMMHY